MTVFVQPHECFLCDCTPDGLGSHCEDHFEVAAFMCKDFKPCQPCPKGAAKDGHYLQMDFDGGFYCSQCLKDDPESIYNKF